MHFKYYETKTNAQILPESLLITRLKRNCGQLTRSFFWQNRLVFFTGFSVMLLLSACSKPVVPPEPTRPVKSVHVGMEPGIFYLNLPGEVRARKESPLAFRIGGKITECKVNLGETVQRGQLLAKLEPTDYQLASQAASATVAEAKSTLILAEAELVRYRDLRARGFVSAAVLDQKQAAAEGARARVDATQSAYSEQSRQLDYTSLSADINGVISAYNCNPGQVVNQGQPIMQLAQSAEKEILIHVPEAEFQLFRSAGKFAISLNAFPDKFYQGTLRELAAAADPATRTYSARIVVKNADAQLQLGMSATVDVQPKSDLVIRLPLVAVVTRDNHPSVWKIDNTGSVHATAISIAGIENNTVRIASGLNSGDLIVTAGANLLREGERVKVQP
jgi:RND family efflux transporter MFP subunit